MTNAGLEAAEPNARAKEGQKPFLLDLKTCLLLSRQKGLLTLFCSGCPVYRVAFSQPQCVFLFMRSARSNSRCIVEILVILISFGHTASHSPSLEQEPKPS